MIEHTLTDVVVVGTEYHKNLSNDGQYENFCDGRTDGQTDGAGYIGPFPLRRGRGPTKV